MAAQVVISGQVNYQGNSVPFAPIQVCVVTSTGTPCVPVSNLYSDYGLSHSIGNPNAADQYGNYTFYAASLPAPTFYVVQVTPTPGLIWPYVVSGAGIGSGGSVNAGTTGQLAYYAANGTVLSGVSGFPVNVTEAPYNVVADNVTDNTAGLQAAINATSFSGQNVFVPSAPAGDCYKFTRLYFYYDAVLNPGYNQSGGYSFNFGGNRTSGNNDGIHAGDSTATTCLTSTSTSAPAFNFGGGPGFAGRTGTSTITQTSMSSGTATFSWTLVSGAAPVNGQIVQIGGTTNGSGQFNLQGATIATVSGTTSGTFTVTGIIPAATYGSQAETGTASYGAYNYLFEETSIHDLTLNVTSNAGVYAIDSDMWTGFGGVDHITVNQYGAGNGVRTEDNWEQPKLSNLLVYSEYGQTYAAGHGGIYPAGTVGLKMCNNISSGLTELAKNNVEYWDHGYELGSVNSVTNCAALLDAERIDSNDGSNNNIGYWIGRGPQGGIDHPYAESVTTEAIRIGSNFQGPMSITNGMFYILGATNGAIYVNQNEAQPGYGATGLNFSGNNFYLNGTEYGIQIIDSSANSQGSISDNNFVSLAGTPFGIGLPASSSNWAIFPNAFALSSSAYNIQNQSSALLSFTGTQMNAQSYYASGAGFSMPTSAHINLGGAYTNISSDGNSDIIQSNFGTTFSNSSSNVAAIDNSGNLFLNGAPGTTNWTQLTSSPSGHVTLTLPNFTSTLMASGAGTTNPYTVNTGFNINSGSGVGTLYLGTTGQSLSDDGFSMVLNNAGGFDYFRVNGNTVAVIDNGGDFLLDTNSGVSTYGKLTGSFTAARTFTFPDASGTVLLSSGSTVTQLVAGTNVTLSPVGGTGVVTINSTNVASTAWSALSPGTNTAGAFFFGTGASLAPSGSGTIAATTMQGGGNGSILFNSAANTTVFDTNNFWYSSTGGPSSTPAFAGGPRGSNTLLGVFNAFQSVAGATGGAFYNTGAQSSTGGAFVDAYSDPGAAMTSGSQLGCFRLGGNTLSPPAVGVGGSLCGYAAANWSNTSYPTTLKLYTVPTGSTTPALALTVDNTQTATFANLPILPGTGWVYANNTTVATVTTTPSFASGTTAVTQSTADTSTDVATDAFVHNVVGTQIADATFTVSNATVVGANSCVGPSTVTMTGVTTTSTFNITASTDTHAVTGWGAPAAGVLYITDYPTSNTLNYYVCNNGSASITTSGSVTFNVSAHL